MVKFPSQSKMTYQTGSIGTGLTAITSGSVSGDLNIPKDLSVLNRRGFASTDHKGVPFVYKCIVNYYLQDEDMNGISAAVGSDFASTLDIYGCQNNWVFRNAAVKWHAARNKMFRSAGIPKSDRGAYSHEIRYNYNANDDTWLVPIDGDGDAFAGGTWDVSTLAVSADTDIQLKLVGSAFTEDSAASGTVQNMAYSYMMSRSAVPSDSNLESSLVPADHSLIRELLNPETSTDTAEEVDVIAEGEGDNPPYAELNASNVNHDLTEPVLLGRCVAGLGTSYGTAIVDIPFGLAGMKASLHDAAGTSVTSSGLITVEVIDIYPMQG